MPDGQDDIARDTGDRTEIRKGRKFGQVLAGARKIFLRDGYEGASVDDIAREAGVSKATLYSYFPDKKLLFLEVAKAECGRQAEQTLEVLDLDAAPEQVLRTAAEHIVTLVSSEFGQKVFRICVAESDRFPQLGREFYHSGPHLVRQRISEYLRRAVARGELAIEDIELAADQFHELCKANIQAKLIFGINDCCPARDAKRTVDGAVEMFLARYGVRQTAG
ncbi:TetR/AcrR family transcriptional regulator [Frigidibacter sp. MR17.14]|uniref:TetR/AcrR family transcriptional regulator n=1 Tax=Frigidibacter sp. MR17.14 TaxID=3126509 RepID=UPI0030130326